MKLTKSKLKRIIKEELRKVLKEDGDWAADSPMARASAEHCAAAKQKYAKTMQRWNATSADINDGNYAGNPIEANNWYKKAIEKLEKKYPDCDLGKEKERKSAETVDTMFRD
jgi:hypothetical protein